MIEPTKADIDRRVIYTGNRYPGGKLERGVITGLANSLVFVRYGDEKHSKATSQQDLEWDNERHGLPRGGGQMKTTLSKREADEQATRAQQIVTMTSLFFTGQEPGVIGSALAELMATFLTNHKIPHDVAAEADLRTEILRTWCEAVWELVAVNEGRSETKQ